MIEKKRITFAPTDINALIGEAEECVNAFIPAARSDLKTQERVTVMMAVAQIFVDNGPIDLSSFRLGMYALAVELMHREAVDERAMAGMRFIV